MEGMHILRVPFPGEYHWLDVQSLFVCAVREQGCWLVIDGWEIAHGWHIEPCYVGLFGAWGEPIGFGGMGVDWHAYALLPLGISEAYLKAEDFFGSVALASEHETIFRVVRHRGGFGVDEAGMQGRKVMVRFRIPSEEEVISAEAPCWCYMDRDDLVIVARTQRLALRLWSALWVTVAVLASNDGDDRRDGVH